MTSKRELLTTIEHQKEQILKYETKLKDVVRAYKGLHKEKEALEASLSALTSCSAQPVKENADATKQSESSKNVTENSKEENNEGASTEVQPKDEEQGDAESTTSAESLATENLHKKIATLSSALSTVSSEKTRIESSFQSDKKRLLLERDKLEKGLQEAQDAKKATEISLEEKLQELKSRLIVAQHERDQDTQTTAVMIRELESKLALERNEKEKLESALEEAQQKPQPVVIPQQRPLEQYEKKITNLQNELEQVRSRLKKAEEQAEQTPILRKIQGQMADMRTQHIEAIQQERMRAEAVEDSARDFVQTHEERVATLEARLAELSLTVASYDRTRQDDLNAIHKLKEKVSELAQENSSLVSRLEPDMNYNEVDVNSLCKRLSELKEKIVKVNMNAPNPVDIENILYGGENIHMRCHQDYDRLKEEFERYKMVSHLESRNTGEASACKTECVNIKEELRQKIRSLTSAAQLASDSHVQQVASLREEVLGLKASHENQIRRNEIEHRTAMAAIEQQLSMQQLRSLNTLSERDNEIQRLTQQIHELRKAPSQNGLGSYEAAAALLSQVSGGSDGPLLHHLEETARKDQEIAQLRRDKKLVETTMREVQMAALVRQQAQQETIEALEDEVERYRRNVSREGENLEYLKNVVLQYMTSSDFESRQLMLNAISAVLKFTPKEIEGVKKYNALWWWQPAPKSNGSSKSVR